jgi:hypothetical protein
MRIMRRISPDTFTLETFIEIVDDTIDRIDEILNTGQYELPESLHETFAELFAQVVTTPGCSIAPMPAIATPFQLFEQAHPYDLRLLHVTEQEIHTMFEAFGFAIFAYDCGNCDRNHLSFIFNSDSNKDLYIAMMALVDVVNTVPNEDKEKYRDKLQALLQETIIQALDGSLFSKENIMRMQDLSMEGEFNFRIFNN